MSRRSWVVIASLVAVLVIVVLVAVRPRDPDPSTGQATATPAATTTASVPPVVSSAAPTPVAPTPVAPTPDPTAVEPTGDPRLRYAEFLLRINDDRTEVDELNAALTVAGEARDTDAVRSASVDILAFVDAERVWLRQHPPAGCYRDAHTSALDMLVAYGTVAERFIDWTTTTGTFDRLVALTDALEAADQARAALDAFGQVLEATRCPT